MKQSNLFTKTSRDIPKGETSLNAQILIRSGFIDKLGAGIYSYLPLGLRVLNKIVAIVREEMNSIGGQEILMPGLNPSEFWETTGRFSTFDALFKLKGSDSKDYALGATHEEIVTPLAKRFILSYQDMPFSVYQIQTKFRNEKRAKAGLIRGREFLMKDMYSFHTSFEDLDRFYGIVCEAYFRIYAKLGLKDITYLTYASGGAFSKYSHEFQTITNAGEDDIFICQDCKIAINKEIIADQADCPECGQRNFVKKKAIEVGNIFKLGERFSKPFNLSYSDKDASQKNVIMGCYGFGPSRVMGAIAEIFNDDRGLVWPEAISPFQVHLISIRQDVVAEALYQEMVKRGIEVLYDDRDLSAGQKLFDADLMGCYHRVVVGNAFVGTGKLEVKKRAEKESQLMTQEEFFSKLKN